MFSATFPKAFVFDLDGTLVDSVPDLAWALNAALNDMLLPQVTQAQVRTWVGNGSVALVQRAVRYVLGEGSDDSVNTDLHDGFLKHYKVAVCQHSCLYPGVMELLTHIQQRGLPMVLVTNKPFAFVPPLLKALGIDHFFSLILGGDSLKEKKPSPEPLLHAAQHLALNAQNCLMVGDSLSDFKSARAANMPILLLEQGYNQGVNLQDLNPDSLLADINQLREHIKRI
jgi:phosphoglycolate phosphatase